MEWIVCDLCGSTQADHLIGPDEWNQPVPQGLAMVRCRDCGLIYLNPRPTPAGIGQYYPEDYMSFHRAIEDEPSRLMRWARRRKLIQRRKLLEKISARAGGAVLDVGCGTGLFLHEMELGGWQAKGVEPSPTAAAYARDRFGLDVTLGFLKDLDAPAASFDLITFWDVLEHTFSPSADLAAACSLLKPGGLLAVNVPNWQSIDRTLFGPHWIGYDPPRHLYVFTIQTLARLLEKSSFTPIRWASIMPGYFAAILSFESWLKARSPKLAPIAPKILNIPGMRTVFEPYFALLNLLNRAPTISVFARKGN